MTNFKSKMFELDDNNESVYLRAFIKDLFNSKKPLLIFENNDNTAKWSELDLFIPNDFVNDCMYDKKYRSKINTKNSNKVENNKSSKTDYYSQLLLIKSPDYRLGNFIIDKYSKENDKKKKDTACATTLKFVKHFEAYVNNGTIKFDEYNLLTYLQQLSDIIVPKSEFKLLNNIYLKYINSSNYSELLPRIFLSLLTLQKPSKKNNERKYLNSSNKKDAKVILGEIWCPFSDKNKELFKYITEDFFQKSSFESVIDLCENNDNFIKDDDMLRYYFYKSKIEVTDRYTVDIIEELQKCNTCGDAFFLLHQIFQGKYLELSLADIGKLKIENVEQASEDALKKAVDLCSPDASLLEASNMLKSPNPNCDQISNILDKIQNKVLTKTHKSEYHYLRGCCLSYYSDNDPIVRAKADDHFKQAIEYGNKMAQGKLQKTSRIINDFERNFEINKSNNICIVNSFNYNTKVLLNSLPQDYSVYQVQSSEKKPGFSGICIVDSLKTCLYNIIPEKICENNKYIFAFLSDDCAKNLNCGLEVLDRLFNYIHNKSMDEKIKLSKSIEIYIRADYEYASIFIDSSLTDMGEEIYFKTIIVDPNRDTILNLLYEKPLFIPFLNNSTESNIMICSKDYNFAFSLIREIMAVGYMGVGYPVSFSVVNENINELENLLVSEMPGAYIDDSLKKHRNEPALKKDDIMKCTRFNYNPLNESFLKLFYNLTNSETKDLHEAIHKANYFIVDVGTDEENIKYAVNLRKLILLNTESINEKPFIAVRCSNSKTATLASRMTMSNSKQGEAWQNNYDLYFFGMTDALFSYPAMINNSLRLQAERIHLSYCDIENKDKDVLATHNALHDFYCYQYNQDSSLIEAISLRYRLFMEECYLHEKNVNLPFSIKEDCELIEKYNTALEEENEIEDAGAIEQCRWNNFMLSRGWSAPTQKQLENYLEFPEQANHKFLLAKLHPYIANWEELDENCKIFTTIKEFYLKKFNKKVAAPQEITKNSVINTGKWLSIIKEYIE